MRRWHQYFAVMHQGHALHKFSCIKRCALKVSCIREFVFVVMHWGIRLMWPVMAYGQTSA